MLNENKFLIIILSLILPQNIHTEYIVENQVIDILDIILLINIILET